MTRYIDADEFADFIKRWGQGSSLEDVIEWLQTGESADVVEVVRCKDCKYYVLHTLFGHTQGWCERLCDEFDRSLAHGTEVDDYCSYGERADK